MHPIRADKIKIERFYNLDDFKNWLEANQLVYILNIDFVSQITVVYSEYLPPFLHQR